MRGTMPDTRTDTRQEVIRENVRDVSRRTWTGGGKLISGGIMAGSAMIARTIAAFPNVEEGSPTAILTWVVFAFGVILAIWGLLDRADR
jgi:hypothetical protein